MRVFIAEKPDLAGVIAEALGSSQRKAGFFQCGPDVVTWCIGHLLELSPPEAHTAIIPTGTKVDMAKLTADEKAVYLAIVKRYMVQFMPEKGFLAAEVLFEVASHTFVAHSYKTTQPGWTALIGTGAEDEDDSQVTDEDLQLDVLSALKASENGVQSGSGRRSIQFLPFAASVWRW